MRKFRHLWRDVSNMLRYADTFELSRSARCRLAWFAFALTHDGNISLTCRHFGISRSTFLRWAERFDPKDPQSLEDQSRRPHTVRQSHIEDEIVEWIRDYRLKFPTMGKERIADRLKQERGVTLSPSSVGRVINRNRFFFADLPSHDQKRDEEAMSETSEIDSSDITTS